MKKSLRFFILFFLCSHSLVYAAPLKVVATQTFFADLVKQIGQDKVEVKSVASPKFNVHFIQPKPSDIRNVQKADLYVFAGLDLEAWSDPLVEAAGKPEFFRGGTRSVDLSQGIRLLKPPMGPLSRSLGDLHIFGNPHIQMNPENAKSMARTILEKLKEVDPQNATAYQANEKAFVSKLDQKIAEWKAWCARCVGREIISYHDDIAHFADFLGLKAEQFLEPRPGIPPPPRHLGFLQDYARSRKVIAIVMPTYYLKDAADALSKKVGVKIITICQNIGEVDGTEDVFKFFDHNFRQIQHVCE